MSYLKNILTTGAISKTPIRVIQSITDEVKSHKASTIIELGAGKGEITKNIILNFDKYRYDYYAFELNVEFALELGLHFPDIKVVQNNALYFDEFVKEDVDLIICSLPLSFFSKKDLDLLLEKIKQKTTKHGKGIILFHAFWLIPKLKNKFKKFKMIRIPNIPYYYIFIFEND